MKEPKIVILETIVGNVLRVGLTLALVVTLIGGVLFLWQHGDQIYDYHLFSGEPFFLKDTQVIIQRAFQGSTPAIIQLGVLLLIATPVIRVFACLIIYLYQRDYMYVLIAAMVLSILLFSLSWHG